MTSWTEDELTKIGIAEELEIASLRSDGSLRNPRIIWVVRVDDDLYVRSVNGRTSDWFRGTQTRHAGHIRAGGIHRDVTFVEVNADDVNEQVDAVYRSKYRRYAVNIINRIVGTEARSATLKLLPRSTEAQGT